MIARIWQALSWPILAAVLMAAAACSPRQAEDYVGTQPALVPEVFFQGQVTGEGAFEGSLGIGRRAFKVALEGRWDGRELLLSQDFAFEDGGTDRIVWRVRKVDDHLYEGTADSVVGVATAKVYGRVMNWRYTRDVRSGGGSVWRLDFDEWMTLREDGTLVNEGSASKLGLPVGRLILTFRRLLVWGQSSERGSAGAPPALLKISGSR